MFFDERFNFVPENSTTLRVEKAGNGADPLTMLNIKAPKNGYAYVFVSNESNEHVYFDNLQVTHERGAIVEENHYYAYGLRIAAISSRKIADANGGLSKNNYLYNDKELFEEADLNWYDYGFRYYDPQIGRFPQLDPLADDFPYYTPYQYAGCEPIANVDLDGLEPLNVLGHVWHAIVTSQSFLSEVVVTAAKVTSKGGGFWSGVGSFFKGVGSGIVETAKFAVNTLNPDPAKNSIVQTAKFVGTAISDPVGTYHAIKTNIQNTDWSDPEVYGNIVGGMITPGGVIKIVKYGSKTVKIANKQNVITRSASVVDETKELSRTVVTNPATLVAPKAAKSIVHHIASNKHLTKYTPQFDAIASKYKLKLDEAWNKVNISDVYHYSKHPVQYHEFVLKGMRAADAGSGGSQAKFLQLYDQFVKQPLLQNPNMLNKTGW